MIYLSTEAREELPNLEGWNLWRVVTENHEFVFMCHEDGVFDEHWGDVVLWQPYGVICVGNTDDIEGEVDTDAYAIYTGDDVQEIGVWNPDRPSFMEKIIKRELLYADSENN